MIPVKLTISGFLSYQEPSEIDFTGIHVACISGRNGAGKSAMLDAMTWALFGEARKSDDSIINDAVENKTAKVDFEFIYEGTNYLVRRQKTRGKSTIAEFFIRGADGESWKPLGEKKVIDTNRRICSTLHMDYRTFINASFFLQGKADQFTGQNATERKKILSTILNLDVWEIYKAKATEKRKLAENSALYTKGLMDEAEAELKQETALRQTLQLAETKAAEAEKAFQAADQKWQLAKANEVSLKTLKENAERKLQEESRQERQIRDQQKTLDLRLSEMTKLQAELTNAKAIEENYQQLLAVRARLDQVTAAASAHSRLENERIRLESVIQNAENQLKYEQSQLIKEKAEQERLHKDREKLEKICSETLPLVEELTKACADLPGYRQTLLDIGNRGAEKNIILKNLDEKSREINEKLEKLLANRGGVCPTCGREMDEEHCRIHAKELTEQINAIREEQSRIQAVQAEERKKYAALNASIRELEKKDQELNSRKMELTRTEQQLRTITERMGGWDVKESRLSVVENTLQNKKFCAEERNRLQSLHNEIAELHYDRSEHEHFLKLKSQLAGAEQEHLNLVTSRSRVEPLEREINEKQNLLAESRDRLKTVHEEHLQAENDYQQLKSLMPDLVSIEQERLQTNQLRDRANKELGQAEQRVRHLEDARCVLDARSREYQEKLQEIRRYKDLEKAFGKDGIPALLIEQAVPEIEEQANEVLQQLSNGTMSLQLNTQGSYKSKKDEVKETLEILISDPYGVREYEMFSGGEAFRINFSLRLALSRILAQRAGSRLQTLVIDEGFGSQDDEGRARLAEAITAVQNDFEKILVITHLPELKEAFPSRIEVEKTLSGSHMEVIL